MGKWAEEKKGEFMDQNKVNEMAEKYGHILDAMYVDDATEDVITFKSPGPGKKIPQLYICELCGRKKTIRFKVLPTPANAGKCPRCKKGSLYSDFVYKNYKRMVLDKEDADGKQD